MALHGEVEVNGRRIMSWSARRTTRRDASTPGNAYIYDVEVWWFALELEGPIVKKKVLLVHFPKDGAEFLASRVLIWASLNRPTGVGAGVAAK